MRAMDLYLIDIFFLRGIRRRKRRMEKGREENLEKGKKGGIYKLRKI